jgi:hypothetical protein
LERLIARCLRKDVNRRSQHMADVKLALEELRDESASGKLARPDAPAHAGKRRWVWPAVAIACLLIAAASFVWVYLRGAESKGPESAKIIAAGRALLLRSSHLARRRIRSLRFGPLRQ